MKKTAMFSLTSIVISSLIAQADPSTRSVKIGTSILNLVDGRVIDADVIELIRKYRRNILSILLGDIMPSGARVGKYVLKDKYYCIMELRKIESEGNENTCKELAPLLEQVKKDFIAISEEFRPVAQRSKQMMERLIEESCQKRNRLNSILIIWSNTDEANEDEIFDQYVRSFKDFEEFIIDLYNFLGDVIYSCPKAFEQFELRLEKFNKLRDVFAKEVPKINKIALKSREKEFFVYVKEQYLDNLSLDSITKEKICGLITEYSKKIS